MIRVRIPPTLRNEVGGAREVEASGGTLREVLGDLADRFPGLGNQVLENGDGIAPFVNVYLDSEDVRTLQGLDTPGARRLDRDPPAGDGRRRAHADSVAPRDDR